MHELSLCQAVAATVTDHAGGRPVAQVSLQIGHFRQVVPDALQFCWQMVTDGTALAGATLAIDHVQATLRCRSCRATTALDAPVLVCGACGSSDVVLESGDEFLITSIDVLEVT